MSQLTLYCFISFINAINLVQTNSLNETLGKHFNSWNSSSNNYCEICCINLQAITIGKKCGTHTMCKYPSKKVGPNCKGLVEVHFTDTEKSALVKAHNEIRNIVAGGEAAPQPSAANMRAMDWNDELGLIAERWANQCIYANDVCRDIEKFPVGQNIARGNLAVISDGTMVWKWFDQARGFDHNKIVASYASSKRYSRYTQLVWADSYLLGCARVMFQSSQSGSITYREHLICNYGPTGNIPNQPVYLTGTPCSMCPEGTSCRQSEFESLCFSEMADEVESAIVNSNAQRRYSCFYYISVILLIE